MSAITPPPRTSWAKAGPKSGSIAERRTNVRRIVVRRLAQIIPLILAVIVLNFVLIHLAPGSLFDVMTSEQQVTDPAMLDQLRHTYGVDQPTWVQLAKYIWAVMRLDLGFSYRQNAPVLHVIMEQLPATVILMLAATTIALLVGITAGVLASVKVNTIWDNLISFGAVFFFAAPSFWLGIMMTVLFAVKLGWFPVGTMLGGSVVIEAVFSWPGIGSLLFDSVMSRNFPMVLGVLVLGSLLVAVCNATVDLLYMRLDPRI